MLNIDGKTFMNIQEAVQWLLDNNALPFQCTADYIANTEIGLGTIINPSPAKVRIGSLIFFADSKVATVDGLTENGFMVGDEYNDLIDDIVYVANVQLNASGHLIITLSDSSTIDAGLVKQITGMSIDGSQHLIANYNDGTSTDLGAIFTGNISVSGNLTVSGGISGSAITGDNIIENMSGYSISLPTVTNVTVEAVYGGIVKNGNKLTVVIAMNLTRTDTVSDDATRLANITIPATVGQKLYPTAVGGSNVLSANPLPCMSQVYLSPTNLPAGIWKYDHATLRLNVFNLSNLTLNVKYYVRYEATFLLSDSIIS